MGGRGEVAVAVVEEVAVVVAAAARHLRRPLLHDFVQLLLPVELRRFALQSVRRARRRRHAAPRRNCLLGGGHAAEVVRRLAQLLALPVEVDLEVKEEGGGRR